MQTIGFGIDSDPISGFDLLNYLCEPRSVRDHFSR
jgi:hypothetical protein